MEILRDYSKNLRIWPQNIQNVGICSLCNIDYIACNCRETCKLRSRMWCSYEGNSPCALKYKFLLSICIIWNNKCLKAGSFCLAGNKVHRRKLPYIRSCKEGLRGCGIRILWEYLSNKHLAFICPIEVSAYCYCSCSQAYKISDKIPSMVSDSILRRLAQPFHCVGIVAKCGYASCWDVLSEQRLEPWISFAFSRPCWWPATCQAVNEDNAGQLSLAPWLLARWSGTDVLYSTFRSIGL